MAGLTYKYAPLYTTFMTCLTDGLRKGYEDIKAIVVTNEKGNDIDRFDKYVSSNPDGLNHKDKVVRHGF